MLVHFCKKMDVFYIMRQLRKKFVFIRDSYSILILKTRSIDSKQNVAHFGLQMSVF